jgi:SNF2 family DNA or RNA helicase
VTWQSVRRSELLVRVALTAEQQRAYSSILAQNSVVLAGGDSSPVGERTRSVALQLIHACAHPAAVADSSGGSSSSGSGSGTAATGAAASTSAEAFALDDAQQLQQLQQLQSGSSSSNSNASSSGKLQLVHSMLIRLLKSKGDRVLLFSQFPDM